MEATDGGSQSLTRTGNTHLAQVDNPRYIIIGAGIGGLSAAIRLAQAGKPSVVLEKNSGRGLPKSRKVYF